MEIIMVKKIIMTLVFATVSMIAVNAAAPHAVPNRDAITRVCDVCKDAWKDLNDKNTSWTSLAVGTMAPIFTIAMLTGQRQVVAAHEFGSVLLAAGLTYCYTVPVLRRYYNRLKN